MLRRIVGFYLLMFLVVASAVAVKPKATKITGIFSNMYYLEQAGDLLGEEAHIVYSSNGYYILFQQSIGEPGIPVLTPLRVTGTRISFTLPDSTVEYHGVFTGEIKGDSLIGFFTISSEKNRSDSSERIAIGNNDPVKNGLVKTKN
jgi:hypothetical protein